MLVVGGTSLCGRGREAPKSLSVLELIETSVNIGRVRVRPPFRCVFWPPPFIDQGGEDYTCRISTGSSLPPDPGENSWSFLSPSAVEHGVGRGRRPCESSDCAPSASVSVALVVGVVTAVEGVVLHI